MYMYRVYSLHKFNVHTHTHTHTPTAQFQQRDVQRNGTATFNFDDFITTVMGIWDQLNYPVR